MGPSLAYAGNLDLSVITDKERNQLMKYRKYLIALVRLEMGVR